MAKSESSTKYVVLAVFLIVIAVLRLTVVTGEKFLKNLHPWDYIAMILAVGITAFIFYYYRHEFRLVK